MKITIEIELPPDLDEVAMVGAVDLQKQIRNLIKLKYPQARLSLKLLDEEGKERARW